MPKLPARHFLRDATLDDASRIAEIYAPVVNRTSISFEEIAPGEQEIRRRIESTSRQFPWLVMSKADGYVIGYAYGGEHRSRAAYRWSVDVSVYVDEMYRGEGIATSLYTKLFERLRAQNFYRAFAGITFSNEASINLHERLGFKKIGVYRNVAYKLNSWHDVGWWELELNAVESPPRSVLLSRTEA